MSAVKKRTSIHTSTNSNTSSTDFGSAHLPPAAFSVIQSAHLSSPPQQSKAKKRKERATRRGHNLTFSVFRLAEEIISPPPSPHPTPHTYTKVPSPSECGEEAGFLYAPARKGLSLGMCIVCVCLCCLQRLPCLPLFQGE